MADLLIKQPNEILEGMVNSYKAKMSDYGVSVNPTPGSDVHIMFNAIAESVSIAMLNVQMAADAQMVDTASGEDLDRILATFGLTRRAASKGRGFIQLRTSQPTLVVAGSQLLSTTGLVYQTVTSGSYNDLALLEIESVSTGSAANLDAGAVLQWSTPPAFAAGKVAVSSPVTGAVDTETDEVARARLVARLTNPPVLGNWAQLAEQCEAIDPAIQKAFIYGTFNGPSTVAIALAAAPTATSKSRALTTTKLNELKAIILGKVPEYIEYTINSVQDQSVNVAFQIDIPNPTQGSNSGWMNDTPFPVVDGMYDVCSIDDAVSTTEFSFEGPEFQVAIPGVTQISWIDKSDYSVKTATILSFQDSGGYYTVTIDKPFSGKLPENNIGSGHYIFPACSMAQTYVDAIIKHFGLMGPGQVTNASSVLPKASRKPAPNVAYPNRLDGSMLRALTNASPEVQSANYSSNPGLNEPPLPSSVKNAPKIYVPGHIAFYPYY